MYRYSRYRYIRYRLLRVSSSYSIVCIGCLGEAEGLHGVRGRVGARVRAGLG